MKALSEKLAELSVQAKNTEERAAKAKGQAKERFDERRQQLSDETKAALEKVNTSLASASADAQVRARQVKSKVESDLEQIKQHATQSGHKIEAWQANNFANDKEADAAACIDYAIASVKVAELAVIDAIDARLRAEDKAEQVQNPQPTPA